MKKTYINPTMKVVMLKQRSHLLAGSTPKVGNSYSGGAVLSRGFDDDDFDDFDE